MIKHCAPNVAALVIAAFVLQGQTAGMQQVPITDPVLNMRAWSLSVPAGWRAEGTMLPGSSCNSGTTPVYRATSADGLSGVYFLPRLDWAWGAGVRASTDCLPWREVVSAKDFLTYQTRIEKAGFVSEQPAPSASGGLPPGWTSDSARYLVRYSVNGRLVDEMLTDTVTCHHSMTMGVGEQYGCSALVERWFAPQGKLAAMLPTFEAMKLTLNQQWMNAWQSAVVSRTQQLYQSQTQALLAQGRLAGAQRMQAHQDFMASFERGRDIRAERFKDGQYQKQRNSDNYVDHILDCQRSYSGNARVSVGNCPNRQTF